MRIIKLLAFSSSLFLLIFLGACSSNSIEDIGSTCNTDSVSYAADIVPIINTYCSQNFDDRSGRSCHGEAAPDGDWTNFNFIKLIAEDGSLVNRAVRDGGAMPPSYSTGPQTLDPCEKDLIQAWVDAGAPDN